MLRIVGFLVIFLCSISVLIYLVFLPIFLKYVDNIREGFRRKMQIYNDSLHIYDEKMKLFEESWIIRNKRQSIECSDPIPGPPGDDGDEGVDGEVGEDGDDGERGIDAITIIKMENEKCIICPPGPMGPVGPPGSQGRIGFRGDKGIPGIPGKDGTDGEQGDVGEIGPKGFQGSRGKPGPKGHDAFGGIGAPGPKGLRGSQGPTGKQGPRGKKNYLYGKPGNVGKQGPNGLDGIEGSPGLRGPKGLPGLKGADAKFCPCPSEIENIKKKTAFVETETNVDYEESKKFPKLIENEPKEIVMRKFSPPVAGIDETGEFASNFFPPTSDSSKMKTIETIPLSLILNEEIPEESKKNNRWNLDPNQQQIRYRYVIKTHRKRFY
uniref:Col_cuticle_N domain-containing protein n=1 Tax=Parastrongyloides trichosuri TaxID=131310 RepID=A0A0N4ZR23_PARTI